MSVVGEVERAFRHARPSGTGWWRVDCPVCVARTGKADRKQAMAVNAKSGVFKCWKCQATGKMTKGFDPDLALDRDGDAEIKAMDPPEGYYPLAGDESLSLAPARHYAAKRCPADLWGELGLGGCASGSYAGRVIVPVLAEDGMTWLGWVGRTWYKSDRAYTYPKGMNRGDVLYRGGIAWTKTDEPLLVVEGVFDAIHLYPHAVAVLGKASEYQMEVLAECPRPVVMVMDGDAWLESYAMACRLRLYGKHAGYVRLPPKLDPDEVPRDWLNEQIRRAL
jgi:hypothetical protein